MESIVAITGGGIKGAVAAARYGRDHEITFVHVDYGQSAAVPEKEAVRAIAAAMPKARAITVALPHVVQVQDWLHGLAREPGSKRRGEAAGPQEPSAVSLLGLVPVLLSAGAQVAIQVGASRLVTGLSARCVATHLGLPQPDGHTDRLQELIHAFNIMLETASSGRSAVVAEAPLMNVVYHDIIKLAQRFELPLQRTRTCLGKNPHPCGRCEACLARDVAFTDASLIDPLHAVGTGS